MPVARPKPYLYYLIFALSGFSGLIYESVWSHYLKLFLGHAAYAQALVLVIFMGGLATGAWLISRVIHRIDNPLLYYAAIEGLIGILGLVFTPAYQLVDSLSFSTVIPALANPAQVTLYKTVAAALLILPQSVMLGATFPLMSSGFIRVFPGLPGKSISILYFANTAGAAIALPVSAFYLIGQSGLPGTIMTAGLINICIAAVFFLLSGNRAAVYPAGTLITDRASLPGFLLVASFLTGTASFIYEVTWIRMLSMVLGASTFAFELMLSAFIAGLAIGGYLIRTRVDTLRAPMLFAARIQILMGLLATSTVFLYGHSFSIMSFFITALDQTGPGYVLFSVFSQMIAMTIMLPTTICAGMTLPLFTCMLIQHGQGERSIGQVYAVNTIGAIVGVLFAVFAGMPLMGLKGSLLTGAVIDMLTGFFLLWAAGLVFESKFSIYAIASVAALCLVAASLFQFNTRMMASGVFRHGTAELDDKTEILFHEDGKTSSVTVAEWDKTKITIMTNGKPDAAVTVAPGAPPSIDEATMTLLAALPLSVHSDARNIANIGMGSGMTTHVALTMPDVERVDTVEIEKAMIAGSRYFSSKTGLAFTDPRSRIFIDDARTFFSTYKTSYDIIISEPSNPWVGGVSSLFTSEFYRKIRPHLNKGGILAQWIHIYELDIELLVSILKAIAENFSYYSLYFADSGNLILLASADGAVAIPDRSIFDSVAMKRQLAGVHVHNMEDISFRFLGDQSLYNPFINRFDIKANSDYYPLVDLRAEKTRFMGQDITGLLNLRLGAVPILDILYDHRMRVDNLSHTLFYQAANLAIADKIYDYSSAREFDKEIIESMASLNFLNSAARDCSHEYNHTVWVDSLFIIMRNTVAYLPSKQLAEIIDTVKSSCGEVPESTLRNQWLELFGSYASSEVQRMNEILVELIDDEPTLSVEQRKFLYTSLLSGLIKTGELRKASVLWNDFMADMFIAETGIPLEIEILLAQIPENH